MADTLIKMKTGTIAKMEQKNNGIPVVPLEEGTVYFAIDTENNLGKIVYDAPDGNGGIDRIVMSTQAEYADEAGGPLATTSVAGFMSASDKSKLDAIAQNANNYSHPTATAISPAAVKVGNDALGHTVLGDALTPSDVGALPISGGTLTGALTLYADPMNNLHAATKQYVDNLIINDSISNEVLSFSIGRNNSI